MAPSRHEKTCKPANLVHEQFLQRIWTHWVITISQEPGLKIQQMSQNIKKLPNQGHEHKLCPQNLVIFFFFSHFDCDPYTLKKYGPSKRGSIRANKANPIPFFRFQQTGGNFVQP